MNPIYCISGLGADERVFQRLEFGAYQPVFIRWLPPIPNECLPDYCRRLLPQIETPHPILLGVSFGGMVAIEIARLIPTRCVILISSVQNYRQIPLYFRLAGECGLHRWLPYSQMNRGNFLAYWFFGIRDPDDQQQLQAILRDTDPTFLRWAIHQIVTWKGKDQPTQVVHIHGSADRLFPIRWIQADYVLPNGGHWMIWNRATEVSAVLRQLLASQTLDS